MKFKKATVTCEKGRVLISLPSHRELTLTKEAAGLRAALVCNSFAYEFGDRSIVNLIYFGAQRQIRYYYFQAIAGSASAEEIIEHISSALDTIGVILPNLPPGLVGVRNAGSGVHAQYEKLSEGAHARVKARYEEWSKLHEKAEAQYQKTKKESKKGRKRLDEDDDWQARHDDRYPPTPPH